eukprot:gb/GECG01015607.1/.p1 GENE.gb/GECG01015607.1/~~gb/GECG01015607.1/.p1  ORF type:complete len:123 (+),score=24.54 gb/GECG01015607.1/:1-369(+)
MAEEYSDQDKRRIWHEIQTLLGDNTVPSFPEGKGQDEELIALYKVIEQVLDHLDETEPSSQGLPVERDQIIDEMDTQVQEQGWLETEDYELKQHVKLAEQQKKAYELMETILQKFRHYQSAS